MDMKLNPIDSRTWIQAIVDDVVAGEDFRLPSEEHMDELLSWLAGKSNASSDLLNSVFASKSLNEINAKQLTLLAIDRHLFSDSKAEPLVMLGLNSNASQQLVKSRYRRLMQIYHPDRAVVSKAISTSRTETINIAYSKLSDHKPVENNEIGLEKEPFKEESNLTGDVPGSYPGKATGFKLRSTIGSAQRFKQNFFIFIVVISSGLLTLTYISGLNEKTIISVDKFNPTVNTSEDSELEVPKPSSNLVTEPKNLENTSEVAPINFADELTKPTKLSGTQSLSIVPPTKITDIEPGPSPVLGQSLTSEKSGILDKIKVQVEATASSKKLSEMVFQSKIDTLQEIPQTSLIPDSNEKNNDAAVPNEIETAEPEIAKELSDTIQEKQPLINSQLVKQAPEPAISIENNIKSASRSEFQEITKNSKETTADFDQKSLKLLRRKIEISESNVARGKIRIATKDERRLATRALKDYVNGILSGDIGKIDNSINDWVFYNSKSIRRNKVLENFRDIVDRAHSRKYKINIKSVHYVGKLMVKITGNANIQYAYKNSQTKGHRGLLTIYIALDTGSGKIVKVLGRN